MAQERLRRLAAVWFADIAGYTALSSSDEDGALTVIDEFQRLARKQVGQHGGRIVKFQGDGALAVFDSTNSALSAALELQKAFAASSVASEKACNLRIGLHVGEIVEAEDGDVYGDGVNIAARIESVAATGQVAVSEDVYKQIAPRREYVSHPLGPQRLKGIPSPVRVYLVEGAAIGTSRGSVHLLARAPSRRSKVIAGGIAVGLATFVGLGVLVSSLAQTRDGETGAAESAATLGPESLGGTDGRVGRRWGVVIGPGQHEDPSLPDIALAMESALLVRDVLLTGPLRWDEVLSLTGGRATEAEILDAISRFAANITPDDDLHVFIAGGVLVDEDSRRFLVAADTDTTTRKGIDLELLQLQLAAYRAKNVLVTLDLMPLTAANTGEPPVGDRTVANVERDDGTEAPLGEFWRRYASGAGGRTFLVSFGGDVPGRLAYHLAQGLSGAGDWNGDRIISVEELLAYLEVQVPDARIERREITSEFPIAVY